MGMHFFIISFAQNDIDAMRKDVSIIQSMVFSEPPRYKRKTDLGFNWYVITRILDAFNFYFGTLIDKQLDGGYIMDYLDAEEQSERISHIDKKTVEQVLKALSEDQEDDKQLFEDILYKPESLEEVSAQIRKFSRFYAVAANDKQGIVSYIS